MQTSSLFHSTIREGIKHYYDDLDFKNILDYVQEKVGGCGLCSGTRACLKHMRIALHGVWDYPNVGFSLELNLFIHHFLFDLSNPKVIILSLIYPLDAWDVWEGQ